MKTRLVFYFLFLCFSSQAKVRMADADFSSPLEGRWDLTVSAGGKSSPSWLEVHHSGTRTLVGAFVGAGGNARPISRVNFTDGRVSFAIPPQWDTASNDLQFDAVYQGDSLVGTIMAPDGRVYNMTGVRAPSLWRTSEPRWGKEIILFNGKDLTGWHTSGTNAWTVSNGVMSSPGRGSNIMTDQLFNDFKLHIEFRYPKGSNSGVYLRGRYEIQIVDSKGEEATTDLLGAIYGFIAPIQMMAKDPGEWQSYDVTLVGRLVTVVVNGKTVICNAKIPGITGGAIDSHEGEPGPIMMQGDHGAVDFRNITITPAL